MIRTLILLVLLSAMAADLFGQHRKVKCLLLGTAHSFESNPDQNFEQVITKLTRFNPDIICVESIPSTETGIIQLYRKENFIKARLLQQQYGLTEKQILDSVGFYDQVTPQPANDLQFHLTLARFLYMANDFKGNSDYQWWLAHSLSTQMQVAVSDSLAINYFQNNRFNEYYNLVYPVAARLKIRRLFPADDQTYYPHDIAAQRKTQLKLLFSFKGLKALKLIKSLKKEFHRFSQEGRLFELLNDSLYQNRISDLIVNAYPEWSKSKQAKQVSELWKKRNHRIAAKILKIINDNPDTERVLITFGAAHIPLLSLYLSQYNHIEIVSYHQLPD